MASHLRARDSGTPGSERDIGKLFERYAAGDVRAREMIIAHFLPYARHLARRYRGRGEPIEDLNQVASVGLIKAVDRYDPERGGSFIGYAEPTILGEIRRHFRDSTWGMHVPRGIQDRAQDVARAEAELQISSGRAPTVEAIARHVNLGQEEVAEAQRARWVYRPESLDAAYAGAGSEAPTRGETIGEPDAGYERVEASCRWRDVLQRLDPRDVKVLLLRFGGELPQAEIAKRVGVSQMHVSRILRYTTAALAAAPELQAGR